MTTERIMAAERPDNSAALVGAPWGAAPRGVVSLLDMLRFYGDLFVQTLTRIIQWETRCTRLENGSHPLNPSIAVEIYAYVGVAWGELEVHGLHTAALKCRRIHQQLETGQMRVTYGEMASMLKELRERLEDDLHVVVFLGLSPEESVIYEKPLEGWDAVRARFSKIRHDIEECSKCFALERYGASVFHITLVAEYGVIKVAELFGVQGDRPGWSALERLEKINDKGWKDRSPLEQQHSDFLKNTLPLAFAIKDAWRNKIDHIDNKLEWMATDFNKEVAAEIISATRGFMRRLATDLPK